MSLATTHSQRLTGVVVVSRDLSSYDVTSKRVFHGERSRVVKMFDGPSRLVVDDDDDAAAAAAVQCMKCTSRR